MLELWMRVSVAKVDSGMGIGIYDILTDPFGHQFAYVGGEKREVFPDPVRQGMYITGNIEQYHNRGD